MAGYQDGTHGGNFLHLAACQEPGHIKVMDHHIIEDAAGNLHVSNRRGFWVPGADFDQVHLAHLAAAYHIIDGPVIVVETAAEAYLELHTGVLSGLDCLTDPLDIIINGLLTENMLLLGGGPEDKVRVGVGGGADEHRLDLRVFKDDFRVLGGHRDAQALGERLRLLVHKGVRDGLNFQFGDKHGDILGVDLADASRADDADFHRISSFYQ